MTDETTASDAPTVGLFDAPDDTDEARQTGTAVFDRVLGRYVGGVNRTGKQLTKADVRALVGDHPHAVVKV